MSDTPTPADVAPAQDASEGTQEASTDEPTPTWDELFEGEDPQKVREALEQSRKWEKRAKENKAAADRLSEMERAHMSAEEQAEARVKAAEERAADLEAANDRKGVALEFGLSAEDAGLLDHLTDTEAMRALAQRLARQAHADAQRAPYLPDAGRTPNPPRDDRAEFVRGLVGD